MAKNQIEPHSLENIRAVVLVTKTAEINHRGEIISPPSVISESVERQGYTCLKCSVDFRQWNAALSHLHDMQRKEARAEQRKLSGMPSVLKGGRKRNRKHIIPVETVVDIVRFSRDVLDLRISETMARAVAVLLRSPTEIPHVSLARSRAMRIAAEYKAVKL